MNMRWYNLLLWLLLPLALLRLWWRGWRAPAYRERWRERLGWYGARSAPAAVWVHAVSVGEVQAAYPLIRQTLARGLRVVVTTATPTGARRLYELLGELVMHRYAPFDLRPAVRGFLDHVAPRLVLVMETEIWPNLLAECARRGIPTLLINARLSARSARGYAWGGLYTCQVLRQFALIAAQSATDAARFVALGADPARVAVTGSIKFDLQLPASLLDLTEALRRRWGCNRPVWVAASTHEGEERVLLKVHEEVRAHLPTALLVLVPRHPERFERVAALIRRRHPTFARHSAGMPCAPEVSVYLGDTMGELPILLAAADVAFIGGSLVPVGGHNPIEAAAAGVPVLFGPHGFNFFSVNQLLLAHQAARRVRDAQELSAALRKWLSDAAERARVGERGRQVVAAHRGALERSLALIAPYLERL